MDDQTQRVLGEVNRHFYELHAGAFDATRDHPWPGWQRVLRRCAREREAGSAISVLDVGCGNGRLAAFVADAWNGALDYTGIDASAALLERARARFDELSPRSATAHFARADFVAAPPAAALAAASRSSFDLCCAFGLLHHIPASTRRRELLAAIAERCRPGGYAAISFWRFDIHDRFRRRFRDPSRHVDVDRLEHGDHLVAWGTRDAVRYCHAASDDEIALHIADLGTRGFRVADDFVSDGRESTLNRYVVFERLATGSA